MAEQQPENDKPGESRSGDSIFRRVWNDIEASIRNLEDGRVGDAFELDELQDLPNEP